ncbi:MAG: hypothetical protein JWM35_789 [Verrucomicrobia bacterium]|nr:hypothetical protein [Verrucomicrobiota bacterium]
MLPPDKPRSRGFTLVEVMMAATIIVIGFIGMIEAMAVASTMMAHSRRQLMATQIINQEMEKLRYADWPTITGLPVASTSIAIDRQFWPPWNAVTSYAVNSVVSYGGAWYRCTTAHTNHVPPNATYWTSVTAGATSDIVGFSGATYTLARTLTNPDPVTNIREVNFTVTWVVTTSRRSGGSPLTFTYQRSNSGWFGKYGLNLSYQRS